MAGFAACECATGYFSTARSTRRLRSEPCYSEKFSSLDKIRSVTITLETALIAHAVVEGDLTPMSKRRVAEIVAEACGLDEAEIGQVRPRWVLRILCAQLPRHASGDLGNLQGMRKPCSVEIAVAQIQDLGFAL
jgi:hypothetical protein